MGSLSHGKLEKYKGKKSKKCIESELENQRKAGGKKELTNSIRARLLMVPGPSTVSAHNARGKRLWNEEKKGTLTQEQGRRRSWQHAAAHSPLSCWGGARWPSGLPRQ